MGLGIMGTMEMARNAMRVARNGAEVSGNNLANAANPAYARQRVKLGSSVTIPTENGPQGSGAEVARLEQVRDRVLDKTNIWTPSRAISDAQRRVSDKRSTTNPLILTAAHLALHRE